MSQSSDSEEMLFRSYQCFGDDGILDVDELESILEIALRDGVMDSAEKQVLKNIIYNLTSADLSSELWDRVELLVKQYNLDNPS